MITQTQITQEVLSMLLTDDFGKTYLPSSVLFTLVSTEGSCGAEVGITCQAVNSWLCDIRQVPLPFWAHRVVLRIRYDDNYGGPLGAIKLGLITASWWKLSESSELTTTVVVGHDPPTLWMTRRHKPETNTCPKKVTKPLRVTKDFFCF